MARLTFDGIDDVVKDMQRMGQLSGKVADEMLAKGAEKMQKSWVSVINRRNLIDTRAMRKSVKPTKPKEIYGGKSVDIFPKGKDKKGVRNAEKAFILHYGKSGFDATHFVDEVVQEGEPEAQKAMSDRWNEFIEKGT